MGELSLVEKDQPPSIIFKRVMLQSLTGFPPKFPAVAAVVLASNPWIVLSLICNFGPATNVFDELSEAATPALLLCLPIFWACMIGGANRLLLNLERNKPLGPKNIFSGMHHAYRYFLGASVFLLIFFIAAMVVSLIGALVFLIIFFIASIAVSLAGYSLQTSPMAAIVPTIYFFLFSLIYFSAIYLASLVGFVDLLIADKRMGTLSAYRASYQLGSNHRKAIFVYYLSVITLPIVTKFVLTCFSVDSFIVATLVAVSLSFVAYSRVKLYRMLDEERSAALLPLPLPQPQAVDAKLAAEL